MRLSEIVKHTQARLATGNISDGIILKKAFSSDLMSDVLTLDEDEILLITGLNNVQLIRTAEMADIRVVLLARNKTASEEMKVLAIESGIIILETPFSIFKASGVLYAHGLKPVY